jgi:tetratricopeptide (TPR) repeat protein
MLRLIPVTALALCLWVGFAQAAADETKPGANRDDGSVASETAPRSRFAITLVTAAEPVVDLERYQREFPGHVVYRAQTTANGTSLHVVRVGFFHNVADAYAVRRRLRTRYPDAWAVAVSQSEYDRATATSQTAVLAAPPSENISPAERAAALPRPATAPALPAPRGANIFSIRLVSEDKPPTVRAEDLPAAYRGFQLYVASPKNSLPPPYQLHLGFFANHREAEDARQALKASFPQAKIVTVSAQDRIAAVSAPQDAAAVPPTQDAAGAAEARPEETTAPSALAAATGAAATGAAGTAAATVGETSGALAVPAADSKLEAGASATPTTTVAAAPEPVPTPAAGPVPAQTPADETPIDRQAAGLLGRAREALTADRNAEALDLLEQVLRLPPNAHTQDAQELVGVTRERNGEIARARKEYELYLKLYPEGEGTDRVRQRLAALDTPPVGATASAPAAKPTQTLTFGGISMYYYYGASKIETQPFDLNANPLDQTTLSLTDQSAIISTVDYTTRWRSDRYDNRFVFRDTYTANFTDIADDNRLNAAYYDLKDKQLDYGARVGRQPGNTAGILLPFDGARLNYGFASQWRGNLQAGKLVDYYSDYNKRFVGASLDMGTFAERWNATAYVIGQVVDGISDRQAVGTEIRYLDARRSLLALLDYDTSYSVLNSAVLQGTWQTAGGATYNLLLDRRLSPPMMTTNALIGETATSIGELLNTLSEDEIRAYAKARTATASVYQIGAAFPVNSAWQLGGDVQLTNISGTETIGTVPGNPSTGNQYTYALQAIGTGVLTKRDSMTVRMSHVDADSFQGQALSFFSRTLIGSRWRYDLTLAYYQQHDNLDVDLERLTPTIKFGYNWKENLVFELEIGSEYTKTSSAVGTEDTTRRFGSIGFRWDF